jgi:hypothetical protein
MAFKREINMKSFVLIALMLLFFSSKIAQAEWVWIGENSNSVAYIDNAVNRSGDTTTYWVIFDYKKTQESALSGRRYLSEKSQREIECKTERDRVIFYTWHAEQMGSGVVVYTGHEPTNWEPTSSLGSFANGFFNYVCTKK